MFIMCTYTNSCLWDKQVNLKVLWGKKNRPFINQSPFQKRVCPDIWGLIRAHLSFPSPQFNSRYGYHLLTAITAYQTPSFAFWLSVAAGVAGVTRTRPLLIPVTSVPEPRSEFIYRGRDTGKNCSGHPANSRGITLRKHVGELTQITAHDTPAKRPRNHHPIK